MKVDILAIGVHPDDVELGCSGTLLRHAAQGKTFGILDLSRGELGTRGNAELRSQEALESARLMGAAFRRQLDIPDGLFVHHPDNWMKIVAVIRECRPEIVFCNTVTDRHPDHGRAAKMSADACFYAGLEKIQTFGEDGLPQAKWRPKAVYHYIQDRFLQPDFVVDISAYFDKKLEAVMAFRSQFYDPGSMEPATPISGKEFIEYLGAQAKVYGRSIGATYAEGFICDRTPGVGDIFDLV